MHTSWVEVDLNALKHNLSQVRGFVGESVKIMAVVKADAYGHGIVETAKAFAQSGADTQPFPHYSTPSHIRHPHCFQSGGKFANIELKNKQNCYIATGSSYAEIKEGLFKCSHGCQKLTMQLDFSFLIGISQRGVILII